MNYKPPFTIFTLKNNVIFKTTVMKKNPDLAMKSQDELFDNSLLQINEIKLFKNNEKENINNNEIPTNQTNMEENKVFKPEKEILKDSEEIEIEIKNEEEEEEEKLLGRKRANSNKKGKHTKFSDDNLIKKCKHILLDTIMKFINDRIYKVYDCNIGQGMLIKKLFTLNHEQKANALVEYNKDLLNKTLEEIFSDNISTRYTNFPTTHNKNKIEKLMNEEDEKKRIYFNNLFNLRLDKCLNHFIGIEIIKELEGLKTINEVLEDYNNDPDYKECLEHYLKNYKQIINSKKSRAKRDKNK